MVGRRLDIAVKCRVLLDIGLPLLETLMGFELVFGHDDASF